MKDSIFRGTKNSFNHDYNLKQSKLDSRPVYHNHDFYNTNSFMKTRNPRDKERFDPKNDEICNEINSRVQNAMRRIEKKYRHKNNLNSQENKLSEKYSDRRNHNNENLERRGSQKHKNVHHKKSENYFSKTQNLGFNNTHSKLTSKPTTLDFINTSETEYNHNGHAYLDKMNQDEEKRVKKLHGEMRAFNDKINDLQKGANTHHRETFYSCLENKIKEKIQGLGNSGIKFENISKISNLNNFPEPNEFNILNNSSAFNKTKSQFRATVTGCDNLSPINEGQQPTR